MIKNRHDFKNHNQDYRHQQEVKKILQQCKTVQEVDLVISVPKVTGGIKKNITDASLYVKNVNNKSNHQEDIVEKKQQDKKQGKNLNRQQFYTILDQHIRKNKISQMTANEVKQCFKKSSLDQLRNEEASIISLCSQMQSLSRIETATNIVQSNRDSHVNSKFNITQKQQIQGNKVCLQSPQSQKKYLQEKSNLSKESKIQDMNEEEKKTIAKKLRKIAKRIQQKKRIKKIKKQSEQQRKQKLELIKQYFQEEAQHSDIQGQNFEVSSEEQEIEGVMLNEELQDLIDENQDLLGSQDQAYRRFVEDMRLQDDKLLERIKNGIKGIKIKYIESQSEKKIRQRMSQAAERNKQLDRINESYLSTKIKPQKKYVEMQKKPIDLSEYLGVQKYNNIHHNTIQNNKNTFSKNLNTKCNQFPLLNKQTISLNRSSQNIRRYNKSIGIEKKKKTQKIKKNILQSSIFDL